MIDLLKRNGADLINLFVLPILIALLPWRIGFAVLRFMARHDRSHNAAIEQAWLAAAPHCPGEDAANWKWRFRLLRLLERVDTWLVFLRSSRWWARHIDRDGEWPRERGPFVMLTYHWGGGQWIWRQLQEQGMPAHFIARRAHANDLGAGRVALWYARVREWGITRHGNRDIIFTGGSRRRIDEVMGAGGSVVGMMDLPPAAHQKTIEQPLLDGVVRIPLGLANLAAEVAASVLLFHCSFDIGTGRRKLKLLTLPAGCPAEEIGRQYLAELDRCLRRESAFWQLWPTAPLMFVAMPSRSVSGGPPAGPA
ncbi:hypothetical protein [Dokdonella immobilis]|uniref:KDO2-lipid IV(A) lauroyltransferase n=1 Tax=Dokdonella immobilis TaxID=578942 RepID=A0A1I4ZRL2_9GAMM|nr:hypothetical protein [Dokdonella immobilis]SFN52872.1 hypothetical protein SAMN05216289_12824 [Dokdonella immobilis]